MNKGCKALLCINMILVLSIQANPTTHRIARWYHEHRSDITLAASTVILSGLGYLVYSWPLITIVSLDLLDACWSAGSEEYRSEYRKRHQQYTDIINQIHRNRVDDDLFRTKLELIRVQNELRLLKSNVQ